MIIFYVSSFGTSKFCIFEALKHLHLPCCALASEEFAKDDTKIILKRIFEEDQEQSTLEVGPIKKVTIYFKFYKTLNHTKLSFNSFLSQRDLLIIYWIKKST